MTNNMTTANNITNSLELNLEQLKNKPIEFIYYNIGDIDYDIESCNNKWIKKNISHPNQWDCVKLVLKNWRGRSLDLMIAYNETNKGGIIVLGHWNDGII